MCFPATQDSSGEAVVNKLFGIEQHTSLKNEESGESIEVRPTPAMLSRCPQGSLSAMAAAMRMHRTLCAAYGGRCCLVQ